MSFQIMINGQPFERWESASVNRSIDSNSGTFRFSNSSVAPLSGYPVRAGDAVEILIDGVTKITGFVDEISISQSDNTHTIEVSGRDNTADLIDSSVPDAAKVKEGPITLKALCENVISAIGATIPVIETIENITEFTEDDLQAAGSGSTCIEYLVSFARKRQVYLVPNGIGGLLIFRPDLSIKSKTPLLHQINSRTNNVKAYSFRESRQDRFNRYLCRSQDNFGFNPFAESTDNNNEATDGQIRESRYIEFQAEESMTDTECKERAAEESNIRRAMGTNYTATVAGTIRNDGTVWDFGEFVDIIDDYADVSGMFLIKAVEYAIDIRSGSRTVLTCVPPDAYQVVAEPTPENERSAEMGKGFND